MIIGHELFENNHAKPFLKWAGGKKSLLPYLLKLIPKDYNNYYEPFLGGGSLFFALHPRKAYLSDLNGELINAYMQIKTNTDGVIKYLKRMKYNRKSYYKIREMKPQNNLKRAARFIYLNKTCWNGLYRVNPQGEFNVPIGRYKNPTICDKKNLQNASRTLKNAVLKTTDFESIVTDASKNDLIYFDPPYTTSNCDNGFINYNSKLFLLNDQIRLQKTMIDCDRKGCKIIMSNSNHLFIKKLYKKI